MKIHEFYSLYDTEEKCIEKFRSIREPLLPTCPQCGAHNYKKEIMYQLSYDSYESVWLMMMKLRDVMGKRDNEYNLDRWVEVDEAFFPTAIETDLNGDSLSSGLGSEQMTKVLVIVKSMFSPACAA